MVNIISEIKHQLTEKQKQLISENIPWLEYKDGLFKYLHSYYKLMDVCIGKEICNKKPRKTAYIYLKHVDRTDLKIIKCWNSTLIPYYDPWTNENLPTKEKHRKLLYSLCHKRHSEKQKTEKRICPICGKEFYVRPTSNRITCGSQLCQKKYYYCKSEEYRNKKKKEYKIVCKNCGKEFITNHVGRRFHCKECYIEYYKHLQQTSVERVVECPICGTVFTTRIKHKKYCCPRCRVKAQLIKERKVA